MTDSKKPIPSAPSGDNRRSLQPTRSYAIPGGPQARNLGETTVKVLAEIERGGADDFGYGNRR